MKLYFLQYHENSFGLTRGFTCIDLYCGFKNQVCLLKLIDFDFAKVKIKFTRKFF